MYRLLTNAIKWLSLPVANKLPKVKASHILAEALWNALCHPEGHGCFFFSRGDWVNPLPWRQDETHSYGFLHRLDVPSSGLVLAAKTYEVQLDVVDGP